MLFGEALDDMNLIHLSNVENNDNTIQLSSLPFLSTINLPWLFDSAKRIQGSVLPWKSKAVSKKSAAEKHYKPKSSSR